MVRGRHREIYTPTKAQVDYYTRVVEAYKEALTRGTASTTVDALSSAELGQLAADITCAIKSNMPNAVVAIDHSTWNADDVTNSYWGAMKGVNYDMVWTTGVATPEMIAHARGK